jgi:hypothetical protein
LCQTREKNVKEVRKMAGNTECKNEGHEMHMCALQEEGFEQKEPEKYKELTENPRFKCGNCGAEVANSENVCNPVEL